MLTSNRDEKVFRPAIAPSIYEIGDTSICYPKDCKAGGSWIAMNNKGRICCLLNGGIKPHKKQEFHTRSRGKIPIQATSVSSKVEDYLYGEDLASVEPFTLVTIDQKNGKISGFSEFIWDGEAKHFRELDRNLPHIWSSVTLYSEGNRKARKEWFDKFLSGPPEELSPEKVLSFHTGTHTSNQEINVVMEREGGLKTVSITQVLPDGDKLLMKYSDLLENEVHEIRL